MKPENNKPIKERPILFSGPMVRAILEGGKTQTRRIVKPQPDYEILGGFNCWNHPVTSKRICCPYGTPGDQLWVRETICRSDDQFYEDSVYAADGEPTTADAWPWKNKTLPSIHCPRRLSRITLQITGVRVERLQDITRGDAMQEGCPFPNMAAGPDPRQWFAELWDSINGAGSWDANPWGWVVNFEKVNG